MLDPEYLNCVCPVCGKKFHIKKYHKDRFKTHCCSMECEKEFRREQMSGDKNHQYGLKGYLNASWKSDERTSYYGYKLIRCLEHPFANCDGFVFEHRLLAEEYLMTDAESIEIDGKRYLRPDLYVHHIDGNKTNNSIDNLMIVTKSEHKRIHNILDPRERDSLGRFTAN